MMVDKTAFDVSSLPGPHDVIRREWSNGLVVLVRENFSSPSVVIHGALPVGALFEPMDRAGLAVLTAACLMRGTTTRSFDQIYEALESVGASLGVSGGTHTTAFHGRGLTEDLGLLLGTLADVLCRPAFPPDEVEKLRGEHLTHLAVQADDTGAVAGQAFYELAYQGHPYAIDEDGTPGTIKAIGRDDLATFHRRHFGPRGMVLVIVGAVRAEAALQAVDEHFGPWSNPDAPSPPSLPPLRPIDRLLQKRVPMPGKVQCDLVLGVPGPPRGHADYLPALVGNHILGRFGMMGRIGKAVREQAGLAYYAYSAVHGGMGPGAWEISAGVHPGHLERAVDLIKQELGRWISHGVTPSELGDNQAHFIGRLPLQLETNDGVAASLLSVELHKLGLDYHQRLPGLVRAIGREQILSVLRRYWQPDHYALAVAGPVE